MCVCVLNVCIYIKCKDILYFDNIFMIKFPIRNKLQYYKTLSQFFMISKLYVFVSKLNAVEKCVLALKTFLLYFFDTIT